MVGHLERGVSKFLPTYKDVQGCTEGFAEETKLIVGMLNHWSRNDPLFLKYCSRSK